MKYICYTKSRFITSINYMEVMSRPPPAPQIEVDEANELLTKFYDYQEENPDIEFIKQPNGCINITFGCIDVGLTDCDLYKLALIKALDNSADILILHKGQFLKEAVHSKNAISY